ncbi:MAG: hypothetical protein Q7S27_03590 [Nanoarchaeota archaeon]|nr:hypothetical protein [Nanoarchaeota archaeon]
MEKSLEESLREYRMRNLSDKEGVGERVQSLIGEVNPSDVRVIRLNSEDALKYGKNDTTYAIYTKE